MAHSTQSRHPAVIINNGLNPDYAKSCHRNWACDWVITPERQALARLKNEWVSQPHPQPAMEYENYESNREFLTIELNSYEIYASPKDKSAGELKSLETLDVRGKQLWLDGVLSIGGVRIYVQHVQIKSYSISGYGLDEEEPETEIYVQSQDASQDPMYEIWYRLGRPGSRYKKFDGIFRWVTLLGKHVIDYLESQPDDVSVGLRSFQRNFFEWIKSRYPGNEAVERWLAEHPSTDFRKAVHAHIDYLSQEVYNLHSRELLAKHHLWADCMRDDHKSITPQELVQKMTIATPHTYTCFKNRYFGKNLEEMQPSKEVAAAQEKRKLLLGFPAGTPHGELPPTKANHRHRIGDIQVGDVVSFTPSDEEMRIWREKPDGEHPKEWFAYVRDLKPMKNGTQRLYVIWMYRPEDTTISTTDYPVQNELFFSDHCNCQEAAMFSSEVAGRCSIEWFANSFNTNKDYIVRQKYLTENSSFVTLSKSDLQCDCDTKKFDSRSIYQPGDTVYVTRQGAKHLDPVVVCGIKQEHIIARRLLRYKDCAGYPGYVQRTPTLDNEVVWSREFIEVPFTRVGRRCHVRFFSEQEIKYRRLSFPYDRNGAGDYWVLSTRITGSGSASYIECLPTPPSKLHQAPSLDALSSKNKLSGLSLFSGLGNLDKGLEQSGAVEFEGSVDMCPEAIHTLHANAENPEKLKLWLGSVDDYLATLLAGKHHDAVLPIGTILVICAGSPCPGFSTLQMNWLSDSSLRNASHVTTICSFADLYRPKWAFLENVVNMASTRKEYESELVLSQLVACLVSMGYQVQQFIMSSWNYGSCQQRSRLILSIAAPGLHPIVPPAYTHSHPDNLRVRTVGELRNGQKFGAQEECLTPFPYVSAGQAFGHLPDIGNGLIGSCIPDPDHRFYCLINSTHRKIIQFIPKDPPGMGLHEAAKSVLIPPELYENRKEIGKAYRRIRKDGLVPTITTKPMPSDSRQGALIHWAQDRVYTIAEARLIQGIPTSEVIIGSTSEQMRMIGNAVDRHVSEQLGLALRRAYEKSLGAEQAYETTQSDVVFDSYSGETFLDTPLPWLMKKEDLITSAVRNSFARKSTETSTPATEVSQDEASLHASDKPIFSDSSTTSEDIHRAWLTKFVHPPTHSLPALPVPIKRAYEEEDEEEFHTKLSNFDRNNPGLEGKKKPRRDGNTVENIDGRPTRAEKTTSKSISVAKPIPQKTLVFPENLLTTPELAARASSSSRDPSSRRTRHSGLDIEFKPKEWHKKPEAVAKGAEKKKRRDSRPYA